MMFVRESTMEKIVEVKRKRTNNDREEEFRE